MASSASRGLPGFLRRSLREDYSEDEEYDDQDESVSSASSENPSTGAGVEGTNDDSQQQEQQQQEGEHRQQPQSSPAILQSSGNQPNENTILQDASVSSRASMPSSLNTAPQPAPMIRQNSESKLQARKETSQESLSSEGESSRSQSTTSASQRQVPQVAGGDPSQLQSNSKRPKTYRETQFEKLYAANVVSMNDLKTLAWNGIPPPYRPQSWKILLGYLPTNAARRQHTLQKKRTEYTDAIAQHYEIDDNSRTLQEQEVLRQVLVDVPRTAPTVQLFRDERIKRLLTRALYIWAMRHPASSYVQGINDLAMPLIVAFLAENASSSSTDVTSNNQQDGQLDHDHNVNYDEVLDGSIMDSISDERLNEIEADCYWCLTNLLAGIQDHYTSDQPGVQRMVLRLEELVNRIDADLCSHLRNTGIEFMQFAFKWMNCLLLREFNLKCVIRLWDTYISEKDGFEDFHVYVCAAFLCQFSSQLQGMSFDELFQFMQAMPTGDWGDTEVEMLLSQAFVLSTLFDGSDAHLTATSNNGRY